LRRYLKVYSTITVTSSRHGLLNPKDVHNRQAPLSSADDVDNTEHVFMFNTSGRQSLHQLQTFGLGIRMSKSRGSSIGIATGYGMDYRSSGVPFSAGAGSFFLHHIQNGSGAHPASYPMSTGGSFPGGKAAGT
jgi:hypothetical protein